MFSRATLASRMPALRHSDRGVDGHGAETARRTDSKRNGSRQIATRIDRQLRNRSSIIILGLVSVALVVGWINRFVQDDAFISFSYARNLIEGNGLTWFGTRVEGYTNFLWVLWIALGLKIGIDPILWSYVGGLASFAVAVVAMWRTSVLLFGEILPAIIAVALFITNFTVSSFATGGLETMLQTALWGLSVYLLFKMDSRRTVSAESLLVLSLLLAGAVLTRLDGAVPSGLVMLGVVGILAKRRYSLRHYLWFALPFALIIGSWFAWKLSYYGNILPNTYFSKMGSAFEIDSNGFLYLFRFFQRYLLWPFLVIGACSWLIERDRPGLKILYLMLHIVVWCFYIIAVGGDFMEFRFMVPVSPLLFIFLSYLICRSVTKRLARYAPAASVVALMILVFASYHHARTFDGVTEDKTLDSIPALATFYGGYPDGDWDRLGKRLGDELRGTNAILAMDAVGAIPYYSRMETVDMWGLNDAYVARHGRPMSKSYRRPGHRLRAPVSYLEKRGVNLIIGHPTALPAGILSDDRSIAPLSMWVRATFDVELVKQATCIAIPIGGGMALLMVYLVRNAKLDAMIGERGWDQRTITL